jgi:ketosteroid isomerase-like protein
MNRIDQIAIEHECARLAYSYCHFIDNYDNEAFLQLWAEDGVWEPPNGPLRGQAEIRKHLAARARTTGRHHCTNVIIDVIDAEHARGRSYFSFYAGAASAKEGGLPVLGAPAVMGEYTDEFKLTAKGWRFARRGMAMSMMAGPKK